MSSIKNSKKNDAGNLLPQRRPRLARYIALAVMLHVAFVIVYIYFTQRKPEDRAEVRTPPVKVVPLSPKKNELRRYQVESPSAPSFRAAGRPMTPPRLMALPKRNNVISTSHRLDSPPMNPFIHSTKPNLITAPARKGIFSDRKTFREMEAWPQKQIAHQDIQLVHLSETESAIPSTSRPTQQLDPLPFSDLKESIDLPDSFQSTVKRKLDKAIATPKRAPAMRAELYLPKEKQLLQIPKEKRKVLLVNDMPARNHMALNDESRPEITVSTSTQKQSRHANKQRIVLLSDFGTAVPPQHKPVSQPKSRPIQVEQLPQPVIFSNDELGLKTQQLSMWQRRLPDTFKFVSPVQGEISINKKVHDAVPKMPTQINYTAQLHTDFLIKPEISANTAAQKRTSLANNQQIVLLSDFGTAVPPQHKPVSQPKSRPIQVEQLPQPVIIAKESTADQRDWIDKKRSAAATTPSLPKDLTADLQTSNLSGPPLIGNLKTIIQPTSLDRPMLDEVKRFETTEKATHLSSEMVWQKEPELLPPLSNYAPLLPELPQLIEDHLADVVKRLIQPALQKYPEPMVRILAKNLTYRDLGLESEGTKFLSGLLKAEIQNQDGVELLSPADVSRNPQIVIEGEMWDDSDKINVRLWTLDHGSGRRMSTADLSVQRKMVPDKVKIQPPSGENLSMIQRMVELMKRNFPRGGDFQLGVWPDKGLDAVYLEGESLMVYILPEKDAFLHVDYYQIDGKVVHLLPSQDESNYVKAGNPYIIGDPKSGGYEFKVSEPFGEELLVVVASQNPLGVIAHDLIEPAEPYIKRLAKSLGRHRKKALMAGTHYIVLTKKRN